MAMIDHVITTFRFNMNFAKRLASDIPEEKMALQPVPNMNHAAWILGHLSMMRVWLKDILKLDAAVPADWLEKFNPGSKPIADRAAYPSKAELLAALDDTQRHIEAALGRLTDADLAIPTAHERMRKVFPSTGDMLVGMLTSHQAFHVGQLSAWRRAIGMGQATVA